MSEDIELSINEYQIHKIKLVMMEYLTLGKNKTSDPNDWDPPVDLMSFLDEELLGIREYLYSETARADNFIKNVNNIMDELQDLEIQCYKKWNESTLTKDGKEEVCQEQNVS